MEHGEADESGEAGESQDGLAVVVEESGPVEYFDDCLEEGIDDRELEQLAYEEDPLLHSDYEDDGKSNFYYLYNCLCSVSIIHYYR